LRELSPRDCFPRVDDTRRSEDVRFWRRYADAERNVGLEVADASGELAGERGCERGALREGVEWKILSWEVERFNVGVAITLRKLGLELVVRILLCDGSRERDGVSESK
jgi:hypothetical protein